MSGPSGGGFTHIHDVIMHVTFSDENFRSAEFTGSQIRTISIDAHCCHRDTARTEHASECPDVKNYK